MSVKHKRPLVFDSQPEKYIVVDDKKDNRAVDVEDVVPIITQAELREYAKQVGEIQRRHDKLRKSLTERVEQGAKIEPGELTVRIEIENKKRWCWQHIADIVGLEKTQEIWQSLASTPYRRLLVMDREENDLAWKKWREKNPAYSIESMPPPMPLAQAATSAPLPR